MVKNPPANGRDRDAGEAGVIPGSGRFPWRKAWQPTTVFLPGGSHGQRSLAGYGPWGHKESDTTEVTEHAVHKQFILNIIPELYFSYLFAELLQPLSHIRVPHLQAQLLLLTQPLGGQRWSTWYWSVHSATYLSIRNSLITTQNIT